MTRTGWRARPITTRLTWDGGVVARVREAGTGGRVDQEIGPEDDAESTKGLDRSMSTDTEVGAELPDHLVAHGEIR